MIICNKYRFIFVHNPKCAGQTVRFILHRFHDDHDFCSGVYDHPLLGAVDHTHVTLETLREYFPGIFEKVEQYKTYAVIRDPYQRFISSVFQRLRQYENVATNAIGESELNGKIIEIIENLQKKNGLCDITYAFFAKQVDFVELNGRRIVKNVYDISNINLLLQSISSLVGEDLGRPTTRNRSLIYRRRLPKLVSPVGRLVARSVIRPIVSEHFYERLRSMFQSQAQDVFLDTYMSKTVAEFVNIYYRSDYELCKQVKEEAALMSCRLA